MIDYKDVIYGLIESVIVIENERFSYGALNELFKYFQKRSL